MAFTGRTKAEIYAEDVITARYFYRDEEYAAFWSACFAYIVICGPVAGAITNRLS